MIFNIINNKTEYQKLEKLFYINEQNKVMADLTMEVTLNSKDIRKKYNEDISYFENIKKSFYIDDAFINDFKEYKLENRFNKLNEQSYINNEYFKNIKLNDIKDGIYEFKEECYEKYEAFVYDTISVDNDFHELTNIGYFNNKYNYLTLQENGSIWMLISPHEINTMNEAINKAHGNVITFGLGLGYFAYMTSIKENVISVTIVERDEKIIHLFKKHILPQFKNKEKIKIINDDALKYIDKKNFNYDYAFIDLYRDTDDGLPLYIKMYQKALKHPNCTFDYWIEESMIIMIRRCLIILLYEVLNKVYDSTLCNTYYDVIINRLYMILSSYVINDYNDVIKLLSTDNIKELIKTI